MTQLFVSYSRVDNDVVGLLVERLRRIYGLANVWYDDEIVGGAHWWSAILDQIDRCDVFLYLLSNESVTSPYCRAEFTEAQRLQRPVVTVQVRDRTRLSEDLNEIQYIDMKRGIDDENLARLIRAINEQAAFNKKRRPMWTPATPLPNMPANEANSALARPEVETPTLRVHLPPHAVAAPANRLARVFRFAALLGIIALAAVLTVSILPTLNQPPAQPASTDTATATPSELSAQATASAVIHEATLVAMMSVLRAEETRVQAAIASATAAGWTATPRSTVDDRATAAARLTATAEQQVRDAAASDADATLIANTLAARQTHLAQAAGTNTAAAQTSTTAPAATRVAQMRETVTAMLRDATYAISTQMAAAQTQDAAVTATAVAQTSTAASAATRVAQMRLTVTVLWQNATYEHATQAAETQDAVMTATAVRIETAGAAATLRAQVAATLTAAARTRDEAMTTATAARVETADAAATRRAQVAATLTAAMATATYEAFQAGVVPVTRNEQWTPVTQTFSDGITMALVPVGCFTMGSPYYTDDEKPAHEQCFDTPFWIDRTEVTQGDFARLGGQKEAANSSEGEQRPVDRIAWFEARDFCALRGARLPTEAEWEYAARGPDSWRFPWGNPWQPARTVWSGNANGGSSAVGSRPEGASWVGALDMSGNVWEWTSSIYGIDYNRDYDFGDIRDRLLLYPYRSADGREITADLVMLIRSIRGGGWDLEGWLVQRSSNRYWSRSQRSPIVVGVRCVRPVEGNS
ncbi:MAG: SUMF1/EgtB/PvdO family nonheme iron enzyme [Anaerolineae bacterium]|nr:SUMF1/EgtB/PvdO family nonheme iron enzyme [Anaerolineae bacterium]